jgi:hypothetical protein
VHRRLTATTAQKKQLRVDLRAPVDAPPIGLKESLQAPSVADLVLPYAYEGVMAVTPEKYEDDVDAFIYYGTAGLIDPTIPGEIKLYRSRGWGIKSAMGLTFGRAMLGFTLFMWLVDPADKRKGGWAEEEWYQDLEDEVKDYAKRRTTFE